MMSRGTGIVGYNVQTAVDAQHHLIVAHEVTNVGSDRDQLSSMAKQARETMASNSLSVVADRGCFKGEEILACHNADITAYVPKPMTSGAKADGRFNNDAFIYDAAKNHYVCPAGETLNMAFLQRRKRHEAASLLEFKVSWLRLENAVHTEQATPCSALGA
jgi:hypothetical protein